MTKNFALIVGINNYEHLPEDKHLKCAVRDAEAIRDFLLDIAGFREDEIRLCTNKSGTEAETKGPKLRSIIRYGIPDDVENLWFFFAGHGVIHNHQDCLIPSDGDVYDPDNLVFINFIVQQLQDVHKVGNIVLILDMCREFSPLPSGDRGGENFGEETKALAREKGIVTIFACQRDEKSYEIDEEDIQHGAFTYCLLQGLRQHTILKSLDEYLKREVPKLNQQKNKPKQTPLVIPAPGSKYLQPLFMNCVTQTDISFLLRQAENTERKAKSIPELKNAKKLWRELLKLSNNSEIKEEALESIDNIDERIEEKERINRHLQKPVT